jgi:hypothetical protein
MLNSGVRPVRALTAKSLVCLEVVSLYRADHTSRLGLDRTPKHHSLPTEKEASEGAEHDGIAGHTHQRAFGRYVTKGLHSWPVICATCKAIACHSSMATRPREWQGSLVQCCHGERNDSDRQFGNLRHPMRLGRCGRAPVYGRARQAGLTSA